MPTIIGSGAWFALGVMLVAVLGAGADVYLLDHFDRGLGRGISFQIILWFVPLVIVLSVPGYVLGLSWFRTIPRAVVSVALGGIVTLLAWSILWATSPFVERHSPIFTALAALGFIIGGPVGVWAARKIEARGKLLANRVVESDARGAAPRAPHRER